jgi:hypothetical protein
MSTSFSRRNPLLRRASKSSVFALDFFHSWFGSRSGGDTGGDVPAADPVASSQALFFPPAAFVVFDGDGFILQVHGVFKRIRSGATTMGSLRRARLDLQALNGDSLQQWRFLARLLGMATAAWGENPKGFGFYL